MPTELATGQVRPDRRAAMLAAAAPAAAAVTLQLAYPLLEGTARDFVTSAVVVLLASACVAHAAVTRGLPFAVALLAASAGGGFAVEQLGVHTGFPFCDYSYGPGIGPTWAGVPLLIGLAWTMLAWPAAIVARTIARTIAGRILLVRWALAATDLFLDPQMVRAGYWSWEHPAPHLPGVAHVPLTNYAGWLAAGLLLSVLLQLMLRAHDRSAVVPAAADLLPALVYLWLCVGWIVALAVFLSLPAAAGWGAVASLPIVVMTARRLRVRA